MRTAIGTANVNQAKGSFDGPTRASTIDANDQLRIADEYRSIVIAYRNGAPIRLTDVADVDRRRRERRASRRGRTTTPAIILNVQRQPGANVIEVVDRVKKLLPQLHGVAAGRRRRDAAHRPHGHHPRLGARRRSSSCCSPSRWW